MKKLIRLSWLLLLVGGSITLMPRMLHADAADDARADARRQENLRDMRRQDEQRQERIRENRREDEQRQNRLQEQRQQDEQGQEQRQEDRNQQALDARKERARINPDMQIACPRPRTHSKG